MMSSSNGTIPTATTCTRRSSRRSDDLEMPHLGSMRRENPVAKIAKGSRERGAVVLDGASDVQGIDAGGVGLTAQIRPARQNFGAVGHLQRRVAHAGHRDHPAVAARNSQFPERFYFVAAPQGDHD